MPVLELNDEQVLDLINQLPEDQKERILSRLSRQELERPRPQFGSAKDDILAIAEDFDAPLDDFKEYM